MKCPNCGAEIPDISRFCMSCGKDVPPPKEIPEKEKEKEDDEPSLTSIMLIALAFMVMFFGIIPIVLGYIEGAIAMFAMGAVMVLAAVYVHRLDKKPVEVKKAPEEKPVNVKIKCRYCGTLNNPDQMRCISCGAGL